MQKRKHGEGLRLAAAAGYSANGAVNFLERWTKLRKGYVIHAETPTEELSQLAIDGLTVYYRTHLLPSERLAQANAVIADEHLQVDKQLRPFRMEYEVTAEEH